MIKGFVGFAERPNDPERILYTAIRERRLDLFRWAKDNGLKIFEIKDLEDYQKEQQEEQK